MYDTIQDLLDAFQATADTLKGLLQHISQEQTGSARGGDENWSVVQVVCHLRDSGERGLERMRLMRDQDNPFLAAFDQEKWAVERNYAGAQLQDALAGFLEFHALHTRELAALPPTAWQRPGQHEELGQITISAHVLHLVSHHAVHLAQIARQLQDI